MENASSHSSLLITLPSQHLPSTASRLSVARWWVHFHARVFILLRAGYCSTDMKTGSPREPRTSTTWRPFLARGIDATSESDINVWTKKGLTVRMLLPRIGHFCSPLCVVRLAPSLGMRMPTPTQQAIPPVVLKHHRFDQAMERLDVATMSPPKRCSTLQTHGLT